MKKSARHAHAVLLRGINVGRGNRIAMAALREALVAAGFGEVQTLLASGNLALTSSAESPSEVAARVEKVLRVSFDIDTHAVAISAASLRRLIDENPLAKECTDYARALILIAADERELQRVRVLETADWGDERFCVTPRAAYLWCPSGISGGELAEAVFKAMPKASTTRNLNTLAKLLEIVDRLAQPA